MPKTPPIDLPDLSGKTLLVVEDNDDQLELLSAFFKACGAGVVLARNVDTALAYLGTDRFDLLVSDLAMPHKDGLHLIRSVRASKGPQRTIPAIAITGFYEDYTNARGHGFDAFMQKPVRPESLSKILRDFFDKR